MSYRYHGRAEVNPNSPHAFAVCDRCGFWYNLKNLVWQYDYEGGSTPINKHILVCTRTCLDALNYQFALQIPPPDPPPVYNVRPELFTLDEAGPTEAMQAEFELEAASITVFFLDLYNGDPTTTGTSSLAAITGSATRTDFTTSMGAAVGGVQANTAVITFTTSCLASSNVTHLAVFDAATAGNRIASGPLFNPLTAVLYNGLSFPIGNLKIVLS